MAPSTDFAFVSPSRNLGPAEKRTAYATARAAIRAVLGPADGELVRMVTVNCLLKTYLPYFYWVGFYLVEGASAAQLAPLPQPLSTGEGSRPLVVTSERNNRSQEENTAKRRLVVGPYQGTLGCLYIDFGRGVCGSVAASGVPKIVPDTHALEQGKEHIACDPNSRSEIVLPVRRGDGSLLGVFDVDSSLVGSFDGVDREELEGLLEETFASGRR